MNLFDRLRHLQGARRVTWAIGWIVAIVPILALGPATDELRERQGYLLYPHMEICVTDAVAGHAAAVPDALTPPVNLHRFRPRLTKDAVLPMSASAVFLGTRQFLPGG